MGLGELLFEDIDRLAAEVIKDENFLNELYGALCNTDWIRSVVDKDTFISCLKGGNIYSASWRTAGAICARIHNYTFPEKEQNDYLSYYCGGNEGLVSDKVAQVAAQLGWKITTYSEDL